MVAAFGSRPSGVSAVERTPAPLIIGLRGRDIDASAQPRESRSPALVSLVRGSSTVRAPTRSTGSADTSLVERVAWQSGTHESAHRSVCISRRTPCAGCGDGTPYDATAPPSALVTRV